MLDILLALAGILTLIYWFLTCNYNYWRSQGIYTPAGTIPGIGHMWEAFTFKKCPNWLHVELYRQSKGRPAVGIYNFRSPALLVRDLDLVKNVLVSDFSSFHDNNIHMGDETIDPHASKNPFVLRGEKWKTLRQKLSPALSPVRVKAMFPVMQHICKEFNEYIEKFLNQDVNVNHITRLFQSEAIAKCAFGVEGNAFKDPNAEFYTQGRKLWDGTLHNPFFMLILTSLPSLNKILRKSFFTKELIHFFTDLIKQSEDYRTKNPDNVPEDFLQYLFSLKKKDPDFTLDDVVAQSLTFFTDGFETTATVASYVIYELTVNPHIQEQLRDELQNLDSLTYDSLSSLPLLDRIFNETMRKYSVFSMTKECTKPTVLQADGLCYSVPKGMDVIIPVYGIHHDPSIYPDSQKFDPDRFLPENVKGRHPMSYLGFSTGPRMCIGYRFGTASVKVLICNILTNFRLVKGEKTVDKINFNQLLFFPVSKEGIWVKFEKL